MSIIMTAGNKKVDWSPKAKENKPLTKVASTEGQEVEERDELFEAAKGVVQKEAQCFGEEEGIVVEEPQDVVEVIEEGDGVEEVSEEAEAKVESVEEAVEAVEEAVEDLKDVVEEKEEGVEDVEDVEDEVAEVEIEVVDEEPVSDEPVAEEGEIIIESQPESCEACGATMASSGEEFVRYASISPSNRKKLRKYWKEMLNYAPDYVDLMTK